MKDLTKLTISVLACVVLSKTLVAKECVNIEKLNVGWTSFKTLEKIGVSGNFRDIKILSGKNSSDIKELLVNTKVKLQMEKLDAGEDIKNNAIKKFFVNNLASKDVDAKVVGLSGDTLSLEITLNGITKVIPMKYEMSKNEVKSKGVIDALDFGLGSALRVLNTSVAGHLNKGWYDIPISFDLMYNKKCI